jgi:hyperosmotically inducible periplasmic protein
MKSYIRKFAGIICAVFLLTSLQAFADDSNSASTTASDAVITTKIKAKFTADKIINPFNISVETNNGVVALTGDVRSVTEASRAVQVAEETDGVKNVDASNLTLQNTSPQPVTDAYITAKVKGMFIREKLYGPSTMSVLPIKVETQNGVVYLSGKAKSKIEADRAAQLAQTVDGVTDVKSTISVSRS